MTRFLLALLALLGIVAQAAPAEARVCGQAAQVRLIGVSAVAASTLAARPTATAPRLAPVRGEAFVYGTAPLATPVAAPAPAVRIKVDRARE